MNTNIKKQKADLAALESFVEKRVRRNRIEAAILGSIGIIGIASVAMMAPNVLQLLKKICPNMIHTRQSHTIRRAINGLIQKGYIVKKHDKYELSTTGSARLYLLLQKAESAQKTRRKKWDGKWRIVIFDIPEKYRTTRDSLRTQLSQIGFVKIQNSVWVYPYQCDEIVALLKFHLTLGKNAVYIVADAIEGEAILLKHFNIRT
jgi:DNA-binding transcriptional regulator PaaX